MERLDLVFHTMQWICVYKGQTISEWIYEVIVSPKIQTKNCQDFCPVYYKVPIIRTGSTYASSALHSMYCQNCPMFGTYNRSFRVTRLDMKWNIKRYIFLDSMLCKYELLYLAWCSQSKREKALPIRRCKSFQLEYIGGEGPIL